MHCKDETIHKTTRWFRKIINNGKKLEEMINLCRRVKQERIVLTAHWWMIEKQNPLLQLKSPLQKIEWVSVKDVKSR